MSNKNKLVTPNLQDKLEMGENKGTRAAKLINELKGRIQEIKFPFSQSQQAEENQPAQLLKPSGKLKFKSAQRFFRMEMVPLLKKVEPALDSQAR